MRPQDIRALDDAIAKWDYAATNGTAETPIGPSECGLCSMYHKEHCRGCPIAFAVGQLGCKGTPYGRAFEARSDIKLARHASSLSVAVQRFRSAAADQAKFLRAIRFTGRAP